MYNASKIISMVPIISPQQRIDIITIHEVNISEGAGYFICAFIPVKTANWARLPKVLFQLFML